MKVYSKDYRWNIGHATLGALLISLLYTFSEVQESTISESSTKVHALFTMCFTFGAAIIYFVVFKFIRPIRKLLLDITTDGIWIRKIGNVPWSNVHYYYTRSDNENLIILLKSQSDEIKLPCSDIEETRTLLNNTKPVNQNLDLGHIDIEHHN